MLLKVHTFKGLTKAQVGFTCLQNLHPPSLVLSWPCTPTKWDKLQLCVYCVLNQ